VKNIGGLITVLLVALFAAGQQPSAPQSSPAGASAAPPANSTTIRGCLTGQRGNYLVVENKTSMVYVLRGVGNKLDKQTNREVEVSGRALPGTVKTGTRAEKSGSNPADTVHGVDGVPFQVDNPETDVRTISKRCKAADQP
jgi:hypothetical protein